MWGVSMGSTVGNLKLSAWRDFIVGLKIGNGGSEMCLEIITTPKKLKSEGTAHKVFRKTTSGNLYFQYSFTGKQVSLPTGKWINEKDYRSRDNKQIEKIGAGRIVATHPRLFYPKGFHAFLNKEKAKDYVRHYFYRDVLIPIKFRKACAKGKQRGINVIVAKEIFIPKQ